MHASLFHFTRRKNEPDSFSEVVSKLDQKQKELDKLNSEINTYKNVNILQRKLIKKLMTDRLYHGC
jgi:predicted CopG family antitoxin